MSNRKIQRHDPNFQEQNKFSVLEAYKTIRTNLSFAIQKDGCKKIVFTSSKPGDGKSTVVVNLAVALSQTNEKVLIIDCDLRKPRIHKFFNKSNIPGLTNVIGKFNTISEVIQSTKYPNLDIICSGVIPHNPAEILASERVFQIISELEKEYTYIFIDSAPVNVVSDILPISNKCDGVIFVVKYNDSHLPEISKAVKSLEFAKANIIGFIINQAQDEITDKKGKYDAYSYYK